MREGITPAGMLVTPAAALSFAFESIAEAYSTRGSDICARSASGSVVTPMTVNLSAYFFWSAFSSGMAWRHGALQEAQKLTRTNLPSSDGWSLSHLSTCSAGAVLPSNVLSEIGSDKPVSEPSEPLGLAAAVGPDWPGVDRAMVAW